MSNKTITAGIIFIVILGGAFGLAAYMSGGQKTDTTSSLPATTTPVATTPDTTPDQDVATSTSGASAYKNGTYTAEGTYDSPGGPDGVKVTLTLANDIVTSVTVTSEANDPTSSRYQEKFISGINQQVIGKSIDSLDITKVSGSSLTSEGFNMALASIKAQAKA